MATQEELVEYIEKGLRQGFNIDYIKDVLVQHGHDVNRVNECIKIVRDIKHPPGIEKHLEKLKKTKTPSKAYIGITLILLIIIVILGINVIKNKLSEKEIEDSLEKVSKLSAEIDEKQDIIDQRIKEIQELDLTVEEKEELIQKQLEDIEELNEYIKEERKKTRDLLLELMDIILKK